MRKKHRQLFIMFTGLLFVCLLLLLTASPAIAAIGVIEARRRCLIGQK
ncbi:hypothetical protein EI42_04979 [Thermosporothrix hazakensis]|uniref:Uncharacterized protein n=2 Tax=Thermosporothrix TaxID=768650 RepID=A0A326U0E9_THEHA|nr:hypothetical protein [Thermosporothrix hazakensis]PZW23596.1 hypothetical protein EI42_04979 [Thermosporothrix hazakensis]BBH86736.1 hypothetical protein KTC_14870 [Thermosporothrix sp. COM3]GCE51038.1 hypothetical protein KTH_59070 [Thermosporothrix hazakensis]